LWVRKKFIFNAFINVESECRDITAHENDTPIIANFGARERERERERESWYLVREIEKAITEDCELGRWY